jgi:hypothetical protein
MSEMSFFAGSVAYRYGRRDAVAQKPDPRRQYLLEIAFRYFKSRFHTLLTYVPFPEVSRL